MVVSVNHEFFFKGTIPASKSIMNRLLVCRSHFPDMIISGESRCDDVVLMTKAIQDLAKGRTSLHCGSAGTVLRFLAGRVSRIEGEFRLNGSERLLSRPQQDFINVMNQLGVVTRLMSDHLMIQSKGWRWDSDKILVERSKSSQFLSSLLLNAWGLDKDILFYWQGDIVSDGYLQMTINSLKTLGMNLEEKGNSIFVAKNQKIKVNHTHAESDLSSAFAVAAIAVVAGEAVLENFPFGSLQPDRAFVEILKSMKVNLEIFSNRLIVKKTDKLQAVEWSLNDCPDLFPVLAVLCSVAEGKSKLYDAPHLGYKESDRLNKTAELLTKMGKKFEIIKGGMIIDGNPNHSLTQFTYDTDEDHRLAFAAGLAKRIGYDIDVIHPQVVSKSFPEFWDIQGER